MTTIILVIDGIDDGGHMIGKIGTQDMRQKLGEILDCVRLRGDEFIIERKDEEIAALISVSKLRAIVKGARKFVHDFVDQQKGQLSEESAYNLVEEAKKKTRKKRASP